jgi:inhibitor of KinA
MLHLLSDEACPVFAPFASTKTCPYLLVRIDALGERAFVLREFGDEPAYSLAARINAQREGSVEAVSSYDTVGLYFREPWSPGEVVDWVQRLPAGDAEASGQRHEIPVCYEMGPDLAEAAARLALSADDLIRLHASVDYRCFALGFCPGFPYLGYVPEALSGLPRLDQPRVRVEPGSVGITGAQTGIYPLERPGGWWLIGKTPLELVNLEDGYFPIQAGDIVRFSPISAEDFERQQGERL